MQITTRFLFLMACMLPYLSATQEMQSPHVEHIMPKISLLTPGLGGEFALGRTVTLLAEAGISGTFLFDITDEKTSSYVLVAPFAFTEFRHFYSLQKRERKGRNWRGNTGAFVGGNLIYQFEALYEKSKGDMIVDKPYQPTFAIGPVWGFQFTDIRKSNLYLSVSIGPGLAIPKTGSADFTLVGHFNLGFVFGDYGKEK